jgi:hypothetical protein
MNATINKTVRVGDAGTPFDVTIEVEYEKQYNLIIVTDWCEDNTPYDNPPDSWWEKMKELISEYFYDQNEHFQVEFGKV